MELSLHPLERRSVGGNVGLDHHVFHLRLRRHFSRRDRLEIPSLGRCLLLVIYAFST